MHTVRLELLRRVGDPTEDDGLATDDGEKGRPSPDEENSAP